MTRKYFKYRFNFDPLNGNTRYTPSYLFFNVFPELKGAVEINDTFMQDDKMKTLPNGEKAGKRIGYVESDDLVLAQFGYTLDQAGQEFARIFSNFAIEVIDNTTAAQFIRDWTEYTETSANTFEISPAYESIDGKPVDAVILSF